jgi:asparagine synthase (glutamine-hydrolysing)
MCGFAGSLSWDAPPDAEAVRRMTGALAHRGPDGEGFFCRGPIALGHRRLAIIDLSDAGREPMADVDDRCVIAFNGEIYNFRELGRELESEGARFASRTDTEVILEAYKRWDVECLSRLNGMFAFALWDHARQRLFLARDRAGEKPLFYQVLSGGGLVFASDLDSLRQHPAIGRRVNPAALSHYLTLGYVLGGESFLDGAKRLEPAHALVVERGNAPRRWRYWNLAEHFLRKTSMQSEDEAAEALEALIADSVRMRLVSDVPLGAFLSGGLDSATIVASMTASHPASETHTYSIGFDEPSFSEVPEARAVSRVLGVDHHDQTVRPDMSVELPRIAERMDEPLADTSTIPVFFLSAFARRQVTVCLSGDGGDENFAGYETYAADKLRRLTRWVPSAAIRAVERIAHAALPVRFEKVGPAEKLRRFLHGHAFNTERAHYAWRLITTGADQLRLLRPEVHELLARHDPFEHFAAHYRDVDGAGDLDRALYVDIKTWLPDGVLVKVDRMTMAHALEARAPFLDHRIMEFAASLPPHWKLKGWRKKHILKRSQRRRLPMDTIDRPKRGFNAPVSRWLNGPLRTVAREAFAAGRLTEWLDGQQVERLWREHGSGQADHGLILFALTCLGLWRARVPVTL